MSKVTIESGNNSMDQIVVEHHDGQLMIRIEQHIAGSGMAGGKYTQTVEVCGQIHLELEDVQILNEYLDRFIYKEMDKKHAYGKSCDDGPRMG